MPAPYSDNMYSEPEPSVSGSAAAAAAAGGGPGSRDDDDGSAAAASALSPSDGYFHASADEEAAISPTSHYPGTHQQPSHPSHRSSASVPYVPNVLVEDPTLSKDPDSKAHLAQRLINTDDAAAATSTASPSSRHHSTSHYQPQSQPHHNPQSYYYPSASPSVSGASVATPSTITSASQTRSYSQSGPSHQQRPLHVDTSPRHQSSYNHQADAPPAYTPSSPDNNQSNYNYSTFPSVTSSSMGVPEEQQSLLPGQQQRAFSDPPKQPLWQRIKDSHDSGSLRQRIKRVLGILVLISIVLVFMGFNMSGPEYRKHIIDKSPIRIPDMDERELVWRPRPQCRDTPHEYPKETFHASLSSDRVLFIEQTIRKSDWTSPRGPMPHVNGEVILRPTSDDKAAIDVEIIANYKDLDVNVEFDTRGNTDHVKVTTPRSVAEQSSRDACIQIRITAWIPQKAVVNALAVNTVSLNVFVQEGLALGAENAVDLATVSGNLIIPSDVDDVEPYKLESPEYKYTTVSGDIKGWFPLYHKFKATTVSGDVIAQLQHKDIVLKSHLPTLLDISSVSGEVKVNDGSEKSTESSDNVPARDYLVKISTTSGDINVNAFSGSSSEFVTTSGDMKVDLVPVFDERWLSNSWRPLLKTSSTSGGHRITVKEPIFVNIPKDLSPGSRPNLPKTDNDKKRKDSAVALDEPDNTDVKRRRVAKNNRGLTALESRHSSISGNLHLKYPASWEGTFKASTMSGGLTFTGKDVVVDKKSGGFVGKEVAGHKGDGASSIKIDELSGNSETWIGSI